MYVCVLMFGSYKALPCGNSYVVVTCCSLFTPGVVLSVDLRDYSNASRLNGFSDVLSWE